MQTPPLSPEGIMGHPLLPEHPMINQRDDAIQCAFGAGIVV